jgi:TctA family transporter
MSGGDLAILTRSYLATGLLVVSALVLLSPLLSLLWRRVSPRR